MSNNYWEPGLFLWFLLIAIFINTCNTEHRMETIESYIEDHGELSHGEE